VHADNIYERIIRLGGIFVSDLIRFREVANVGYEDEDKTKLSMKVKNDLNILTNIHRAI
jgi:DNA-binding ferritin-like protein